MQNRIIICRTAFHRLFVSKRLVNVIDQKPPIKITFHKMTSLEADRMFAGTLFKTKRAWGKNNNKNTEAYYINGRNNVKLLNALTQISENTAAKS